MFVLRTAVCNKLECLNAVLLLVLVGDVLYLCNATLIAIFYNI